MTVHSASLERVLRGNLCAGCGLCETIAASGKIAIVTSPDRYLRPRLEAPLSEDEDRSIRETCPGLRVEQDYPANANVHPLWGPVVAVRTGHAVDPATRFHASSGGALSAIVMTLLERGLVDRVVQNAADPNLAIGNTVVESTDASGIHAAAGSRYAPSAPLQGFLERLDKPGRIAFVGKPCDVAALRALARRDPQIDEKVPFMLSFFCAGIRAARAPGKSWPASGSRKRT